ncbi:hypothetical protein FQN54_006345 [Arachnomyces sp. PD_36]|nr:hypothetical protein FQN54_006345 [Arachnomyces sp. PD_36]
MHHQQQPSDSGIEAPVPTLDRLQRSQTPQNAIPNSYSIPGPIRPDSILSDKQASGYLNAPYDVSPSPDLHPANFAPYADETIPREQTATPGTIAPSSRHTPAPQSPGPMPTKTDPQSENPQGRVNPGLTIIAPDSHPLAHPPSKANLQSGMYTPTFGPDRAAGGKDLYANHLPGQSTHPHQHTSGGNWGHGLCDCTDIGVCCLGAWCPCILYGKTQYRLSRKSEKKDPTNMLGYECCNAPCAAMGLLCGFQWLFATIQHTRIRRAYKIEGSIPSDCVRATCCTCCTLIQDEREIRDREESARQAVSAMGMGPASPYIPPNHMSYAPPPR